jgi:hypothetical protein
LDWNKLGVGTKVAVASEHLPPASYCDSADQEVNSGSGNASTAAFVAPVRRLFEISSRESLIPKGSQLIAYSFKLRRLSNAGEQLLADRSDEPSETILDEVVQ